jgi:hypothetical protein
MTLTGGGDAVGSGFAVLVLDEDSHITGDHQFVQNVTPPGNRGGVCSGHDVPVGTGAKGGNQL